MPLRAASTAAALADPSLGTWLRLLFGSAPGGGACASPFAIVIPWPSDVVRSFRGGQTKDPRLPARVLGVRWSWRLAALVPRPTVPPGAGNEAKKAVKPESK